MFCILQQWPLPVPRLAADGARIHANSGEHGIGLVLKEDFVYFSDPIKIQLMETIKQSIDPKNIMNPNKLIG